MANLAIIGSHSTNGVAELHSQLLKKVNVSSIQISFFLTAQQQDQWNNAKTLVAGMQIHSWQQK